MYVSTSEIVQKANKLVEMCGTRDPHEIAKDIGVNILYYPFNRQRGAYKVILRNRFMFVKNNLHPVMENIVLLHELGHDTLRGYDIQQIARTMHSDINLVALKSDTLISQVYRLRPQEHQNDFLKYDKSDRLLPSRRSCVYHPLISVSL